MNVLYYAALWLAAFTSQIVPWHRRIHWLPLGGNAAVVTSTAALAGAFYVQLRTAESTWNALPHSAAASQLPVHVLAAFSAGSGGWVALGAFEALCLALFLQAFENTPFHRCVVLCGAALLSALAITSVTAGGPDLYEYVAQSVLGAHAYAPPHQPFSGTFAPLDQWGVPVMRSTYGPLWTLGIGRLLSPAASLTGKILVLRAIGLFSVVLCAVLVGKGSARSVTPCLVLLNPFLYWTFVANAHNDLLAVDFALASSLLIPRSLWLAGLAAIACGLIKLPLLLVSCLPVSPDSGRMPAAKRFAAGIAFALVTIALSWLAAGAPYFDALLWYARYSGDVLMRMRGVGWELLALRAVTTVGGLVVIARAWLGKRSPTSAIWAVPCIASGPFQQYQVWSLPVFLQNRAVAGYLAALPAVMACSAFEFFPATAWEIVVTLAVLLAAFTFANGEGRRSASEEAGSLPQPDRPAVSPL